MVPPSLLLDLWPRFTTWWQDLPEAVQVPLWAAVVYVAALVLVRLGKKRFMGHGTAFDFILAFILGSTLSRAINGNASLGPTLAAGIVLVALHAASGRITRERERIGRLVKGTPDVLVRDGVCDERAMARHHVSRHDVEEAARMQALVAGIDEVKEARLERNGSISVIPKNTPRVLEVNVEAGVQTVRIELR